jgi:hypothetical protein
VAAHRPTVSAALGALERHGRITRIKDGWTLHGAPPGELQAISPGQAEGQTAGGF